MPQRPSGACGGRNYRRRPRLDCQRKFVDLSWFSSRFFCWEEIVRQYSGIKRADFRKGNLRWSLRILRLRCDDATARCLDCVPVKDVRRAIELAERAFKRGHGVLG